MPHAFQAPGYRLHGAHSVHERFRVNREHLAEIPGDKLRKQIECQSLLELLSRRSSGVLCANANSAWRGGVESRCGRTDIGRVMRRA